MSFKCLPKSFPVHHICLIHKSQTPYFSRAKICAHTITNPEVPPYQKIQSISIPPIAITSTKSEVPKSSTPLHKNRSQPSSQNHSTKNPLPKNPDIDPWTLQPGRGTRRSLTSKHDTQTYHSQVRLPDVGWNFLSLLLKKRWWLSHSNTPSIPRRGTWGLWPGGVKHRLSRSPDAYWSRGSVYRPIPKSVILMFVEWRTSSGEDVLYSRVWWWWCCRLIGRVISEKKNLVLWMSRWCGLVMRTSLEDCWTRREVWKSREIRVLWKLLVVDAVTMRKLIAALAFAATTRWASWVLVWRGKCPLFVVGVYGRVCMPWSADARNGCLGTRDETSWGRNVVYQEKERSWWLRLHSRSACGKHCEVIW